MAQLHLLDLVLVTMQGKRAGQLTLNTFGYLVTSITGTPEQSAVFSALYTQMQAVGKLIDRYTKAIPETVSLDYVNYQVISPIRWAALKFFFDQTGSLVDDGQVTQVAGSITRRGDVATQSNVGHVEIPAPGGTTYIDGGRFKPIYMTQLTLLAAAMAEEYTAATATFTPCLIKSDGTVGVPITQTFAQDTVRTVRRRTVGLGV